MFFSQISGCGVGNAANALLLIKATFCHPNTQLKYIPESDTTKMSLSSKFSTLPGHCLVLILLFGGVFSDAGTETDDGDPIIAETEDTPVCITRQPIIIPLAYHKELEEFHYFTIWKCPNSDNIQFSFNPFRKKDRLTPEDLNVLFQNDTILHIKSAYHYLKRTSMDNSEKSEPMLECFRHGAEYCDSIITIPINETDLSKSWHHFSLTRNRNGDVFFRHSPNILNSDDLITIFSQNLLRDQIFGKMESLRNPKSNVKDKNDWLDDIIGKV